MVVRTFKKGGYDADLNWPPSHQSKCLLRMFASSGGFFYQHKKKLNCTQCSRVKLAERTVQIEVNLRTLWVRLAIAPVWQRNDVITSETLALCSFQPIVCHLNLLSAVSNQMHILHILISECLSNY